MSVARPGRQSWKSWSCEKGPRSDDRSYDAPWKVDQKRANDRETETSMKRLHDYEVTKQLDCHHG